MDGEDGYKTLRVPESAWKAAKQQKEGAGRTWGEQIVRPNVESDDALDEEVIADIVSDRVIDYLRTANKY